MVAVRPVQIPEEDDKGVNLLVYNFFFLEILIVIFYLYLSSLEAQNHERGVCAKLRGQWWVYLRYSLFTWREYGTSFTVIIITMKIIVRKSV